MKNVVWLFSLLLFSACDSNSGRACTEIGCSSSYALMFNARDSLSIGDYVITIERENEEPLACSFTISGIGDPCTSIDCVQNRSCDSMQFNGEPYAVTIYYAVPDDEVHLFFPSYTGPFTLTINQDGDTLSNLVVEPQYESNQPNGPGCEPICINAQNTITLNR